MAIKIECDGGCGATTENLTDFKEFGLVRKVYYCESCAPEMDGLFNSRDALHQRAATALACDLLERIAAFRVKRPNGKLPDGEE